MNYFVMLFDDASKDIGITPEDMQAQLAEYSAYDDMLTKRNALLGGEALHPSSMAATVRVRHGKTTITDGPFAETNEQIGGFYLIQAKDLHEAIALAGQCRGAKHGTIEVRPCVDFS
jgi:hypothetical protein